MTPPLPLLIRQLVVEHDATLRADGDGWRFVVPAWPNHVFVGDTLEQIEHEVAKEMLRLSVQEDGVTQDGLFLLHVNRLRDEVRSMIQRIERTPRTTDTVVEAHRSGRSEVLNMMNDALTGMLDEVMG